MPRKVDSIESILELRIKLDELGIDTNEIDDQLKKSSVLIARNLNKLLGGEPKVIVNDDEYYIGIDFEQKYLEQSEHKLLPSQSENIEE